MFRPFVLAAATVGLMMAAGVEAQAETHAVCPALNDPEVVSPNEYLLGTFAGWDGWLFAPGEVDQSYVPPDVDMLRRLVEALQEKGTKLVIAVMPSRAMVYPEKLPEGELEQDELTRHRESYHAMIAAIRESGAIATDNLDVLLEAKTSGDVYFPTDHHWTPLGASAVASAISVVLKGDPDFPNSGIHFVDREQPEISYEGSYRSIVAKSCLDESYPIASLTPIVTERETPQQVGLFDEISIPQIVLAGTSYSRKLRVDLFNFGGELQKETGEEVLNVAVNGGGQYSSMLDYLASDDFHNAPPKYLIWETARSFPGVSADMASQLVATIRGACDSNARFNLSATGEMNVSLEGWSGIAGPNYYLALNFEDRSVRDVDVTFKNENGETKTLALNLPSRAEGRGEFFAELPRDFGGVQDILVSPAGTPQGPYSINLCDATSQSSRTASHAVKLPTLVAASSDPREPTEAAAASVEVSKTSLTISAFGDAYQGSPILAVEVDGATVLTQPVNAASRVAPQEISLDIPVDAKRVRIRLANDVYDGAGKDRNLQITKLVLSNSDISTRDVFSGATSGRMLRNGDFRITHGEWIELNLP